MINRKAHISLKNVCVDFPVFNASALSLKNRMLSSVTGGLINQKYDGIIVVRGLENINLLIHSGERIGLVGHNGAGKSTLLRVLSGIFSPTEGEAFIQGECISLINLNLGIDPEATGRENIKMRAALMGFSPKETSLLINEISDFSGLGNFIDLPFRTYSTGMQIRLAFSVSTAVRPQILILDEWLSTGDEEFKHKATNRIKQVVDATEIIILASHSKELLLKNCTRLVWLEHGHIKMDGDPHEIANLYFS